MSTKPVFSFRITESTILKSRAGAQALLALAPRFPPVTRLVPFTWKPMTTPAHGTGSSARFSLRVVLEEAGFLYLCQVEASGATNILSQWKLDPHREYRIPEEEDILWDGEDDGYLVMFSVSSATPGPSRSDPQGAEAWRGSDGFSRSEGPVTLDILALGKPRS